MLLRALAAAAGAAMLVMVPGGAAAAPTKRCKDDKRARCGDGWALVGDAGHHKDPILALGITDALRDAEHLAEAVDDGLTGRRPMADALAADEAVRNDLAAPGYKRTIEFAQLEPPPPEAQAMFAALRDDQEATNQFFGTFAGTAPMPRELATAA